MLRSHVAILTYYCTLVVFVAPEEEAVPWVVNLDGLVPDPSALGACVNPVARDSGFIKYTETNSSSMASFTFKTSQVWMELC